MDGSSSQQGAELTAVNVHLLRDKVSLHYHSELIMQTSQAIEKWWKKLFVGSKLKLHRRRLSFRGLYNWPPGAARLLFTQNNHNGSPSEAKTVKQRRNPRQYELWTS